MTMRALSIVGLLITMLIAGFWIVGPTVKEEGGGTLERGVEAVDQSKEIKAVLDAKAVEENSVLNQLP